MRWRPGEAVGVERRDQPAGDERRRAADRPGYFNDVDPDDARPVPRSEIVAYWTRRQPEIIAARGQLDPS